MRNRFAPDYDRGEILSSGFVIRPIDTLAELDPETDEESGARPAGGENLSGSAAQRRERELDEKSTNSAPDSAPAPLAVAGPAVAAAPDVLRRAMPFPRRSSSFSQLPGARGGNASGAECELSYVVQMGARALRLGMGDIVGDSQIIRNSFEKLRAHFAASTSAAPTGAGAGSAAGSAASSVGAAGSAAATTGPT